MRQKRRDELVLEVLSGVGSSVGDGEVVFGSDSLRKRGT